jgi:hypothetical protein
MAAALATAAARGPAVPSDVPSSDLDEGPDMDALPVPKEGPYIPLINRPPPRGGYEPPGGGIQYPNNPSQNVAPNPNMLAMALAGGAGFKPISGDTSDIEDDEPAGGGAPPTPLPAGKASAGVSPRIPQSAPPSHYAQLPGPPLLLPGAGNVATGINAPSGLPPQENPLAAIGRMLGIGGTQGAQVAPASSAGAPIAGQTSDMAPQTPQQMEIFKARQGLRAQEAALTAQINSTGNADLAEALAKQRAALAAHDMQLEQLYIGTLKQTRTLGDSELTKAERDAGGEWQVDAAGNRSIVGGTEEDTTREPNAQEAAKIVAAGGNPIEWQVNDGQLVHTLGKTLNTEMVKLPDGTSQLVNKQTGELIGKPIGAPNTSGELSDSAVEERAQRGAQGDATAYSGLGIGKIGSTNRAKVANREAEIVSGQHGGAMDEAATAQIRNQVGLGGEKQGARTMGAMGARINTFAEEAKGTSEEALARSRELPREAWVPIEKIIQGGESMTNDPRYVRLLAANNGLANTYSKAINPNGILTDEGKRQAFEILNVARSTEGYEAAVKQVLREMNIVQNSIGTSRATQLYGGQLTPSVPGAVAPATPAAPSAPKKRGVYVPGKGIQFQ